MPITAFILVNQFLGWGEPDSGVWFIGIEERTVRYALDQIVGHHGQYGLVQPAGQEMHQAALQQQNDQTSQWICKIGAQLQPVPMDWQEYRQNCFRMPGYGIFEGNLSRSDA